MSSDDYSTMTDRRRMAPFKPKFMCPITHERSTSLSGEVTATIATAYLRLLSRQTTKPQTTGHLAGSEECPENASDTAITLRKTSVMSPEAGQDGGRNANPSKELR